MLTVNFHDITDWYHVIVRDCGIDPENDSAWDG
jgi:hypothetical protein